MQQLTKIDNWQGLCDYTRSLVQTFPEVYKKRLEFELFEADKQGLNSYWLEAYNNQYKFDSNPNNLVLPWVLGLLLNPIDPIVNRPSELLITTDYNKVADYVNKNGSIPHDFIKDSDVPDIDIDCLPEARDKIKEYAIRQYGVDSSLENLQVASVGTWQTYKFKMAIQDAAAATGVIYRNDAKRITANLPIDLDNLKHGGYAKCKGIHEGKECGTKHKELQCPKCTHEVTDSPTLGRLLHDFPELKELNDKYPQVIDYATRMVGRIRNMGMHAGALIIANTQLLGKVPLARGKDGQYITMWSEGNNQQLSKCGYIKWDILGLKTLSYIYDTCIMIMNNRGIAFGIPQEIEGYGGNYFLSGLDEIDPELGYCGKFYVDGEEHEIRYDDKDTYRIFNNQLTDTVFQFDTPLAKRILSDASVGSGVNNHEILTLLNAMGHPGPMQSIPIAIQNRDDASQSWRADLRKRHPIMEEILQSTLGVCVYQEQLTSLWQRLAGFTATEAQLARKDIAKKRVDKLKKIEEQWIEGASKTLGPEFAKEYWPVLETFGRYAFNRSHAIAYAAVIAFRCAWFKAHFFPEWIASVLTKCDVKKIPRYISMARTEGWKPTHITRLGRKPEAGYEKFDIIPFDVNNLTPTFSVIGNILTVGLLSVKGIGEADREICNVKGPFESIDEFIEKTEAGKIVIEALIKLRAFNKLPDHDNSLALLKYYHHKYKKNTKAERDETEKKILELEGWTEEKINDQRTRQLDQYFLMYPKRKKPDPKILKWVPEPDLSLATFKKLYENDFKISEVLEFEKNYLGYNLSNPLAVYNISNGGTIAAAIEAYNSGTKQYLEVIVTEKHIGVTSKESQYVRLEVSDGMHTATVFVWSTTLETVNPDFFEKDMGLYIEVSYQPKRKSFSIAKHGLVLPLVRKENE